MSVCVLLRVCESVRALVCKCVSLCVCEILCLGVCSCFLFCVFVHLSE